MSADEQKQKSHKSGGGHFTATLFHMFNRRKSSMDSMMSPDKYESKTLPRNLTPIPSPEMKNSTTAARRNAVGSKSKMSSWAWARQRQGKQRNALSTSSDSPGVKTYTPKRTFPSRSRLQKDTFEKIFSQDAFEPASSSSESCKRTSSMSDRSSDSSSSRDVFEEIKEIAEIPGSHYSPLTPTKSTSSINTLSSSPKSEESKEVQRTKTRRINGLIQPPPPGMFEQSKRKSTMYRKKWMRKSSVEKQDLKVAPAGSPVKNGSNYEFDVWDGRNAMTLPRKHKQNSK